LFGAAKGRICYVAACRPMYWSPFIRVHFVQHSGCATDTQADMTTRTGHTPDAKRSVGDFVHRGVETFLVLRCGNVSGDGRTIRVTPDDVAAFFAKQARNLTPGCRTLAGLRNSTNPRHH